MLYSVFKKFCVLSFSCLMVSQTAIFASEAEHFEMDYFLNGLFEENDAQIETARCRKPSDLNKLAKAKLSFGTAINTALIIALNPDSNSFKQKYLSVLISKAAKFAPNQKVFAKRLRDFTNAIVAGKSSAVIRQTGNSFFNNLQSQFSGKLGGSSKYAGLRDELLNKISDFIHSNPINPTHNGQIMATEIEKPRGPVFNAPIFIRLIVFGAFLDYKLGICNLN